MMMNYNVFTKGTVKSFLESFYVSKKNIYKISNLNIYINNEEANIVMEIFQTYNNGVTLEEDSPRANVMSVN